MSAQLPPVSDTLVPAVRYTRIIELGSDLGGSVGVQEVYIASVKIILNSANAFFAEAPRNGDSPLNDITLPKEQVDQIVYIANRSKEIFKTQNDIKQEKKLLDADFFNLTVLHMPWLKEQTKVNPPKPKSEDGCIIT